ncbi:hypothetical protein Ancab_034083 [Ancistrocladus abbreviatus]
MASPTTSVPLVYSRCSSRGSYSPVFSCRISTAGSPSSSSSCINYFRKRQRFKDYTMSTELVNFASTERIVNGKNGPDHLLVLVHGILASPSDWTYFESALKKRLGKNFFIYVSSCNSYTKTFSGIDGAGRRLAEEVAQVVQKTKSLKKISFLSHSLGGLFARYAIAVLYSTDHLSHGEPGDSSKADCPTGCGMIAGLEPINFITLATPHLGVRGRKQLPFLLGVPFLEKLAPLLAPVLVGQTGSQLFLTDDESRRPPLLLRMTSDCEDGKFISALGAFKCRIIYANVFYDHMVGWQTSSVRRKNELPKSSWRSLDGYKHVVNVEYCPPVSSEGPHFPSEAAKAKEAAWTTPRTQSTVEYHDIMEEEMICSLQHLGWKKVDVSFHSAAWPFFAHNNIHVKNEWLHNAGTGVVAHVADSLKQQESSSSLAAGILP